LHLKGDDPRHGVAPFGTLPRKRNMDNPTVRCVGREPLAIICGEA
jgi:hypothetical protein